MGGLSLGLGILNSALGASQAEQAADEQRKKLEIAEGQRESNDNWFNKQYYQNVLDRADTQALLTQMQQNQDTQRKRDNAIAATTGATAEQQLAAQENRDAAYGRTISDLAAASAQRKDNLAMTNHQDMNQYFATRLGLQDAISGIHTNMANQWSQAATNAFTSGANMLGKGIDDVTAGKGSKTV